MMVGKRVRLRAVCKDDLPNFVRWLNDREVTRFLLLATPMALDQEEAWFEKMRQSPLTEHPLAIEIDTLEGWRIIGNIGFHRIDWVARNTEVGIFIGEKQFWSQGYGTEAMRLMLKHGFEDINLNRIFLHVMEPNTRAIRSYEKSGFKHEGVLRQATYREGRYQNLLVMSVLQSEWNLES